MVTTQQNWMGSNNTVMPVMTANGGGMQNVQNNYQQQQQQQQQQYSNGTIVPACVSFTFDSAHSSFCTDYRRQTAITAVAWNRRPPTDACPSEKVIPAMPYCRRLVVSTYVLDFCKYHTESAECAGNDCIFVESILSTCCIP
jgi:hypothetical protein